MIETAKRGAQKAPQSENGWSGTKRALDTLIHDEAKGLRWDETSPGFGVRLGASKVSFVFKYSREGRDAWMTLGRYGERHDDTTVEQARARWTVLRGAVASGRDPARERDAGKGLPALKDEIERWLADEIEPKSAAKTTKDYRALVDRWIVPALGAFAPRAITVADVQKLHNAIGKGKKHPRTANYVRSVLSSFFRFARVKPDPTDDVTPFRERKRKCSLTEEKLVKLGAALRAAEDEHARRKAKPPAPGTKDLPLALNPHLAAFYRCLLLTGVRPDELRRLRWDAVDLKRGVIDLGETKTRDGDTRTHGLPVTPPLRVVLDSIPRTKSPFVFPGNPRGRHAGKEAGHLVGYAKPWWKLVAAAGLDENDPDLVPYSARHLVGTVGGSQLPMRVVSTVLGHRQISTTMRYASEHADAGARGAVAIATTIAKALG